MGFNLSQFRKEIKTSLNQLRPLASYNAQRKFESERLKTLIAIEDHPVTQEIKRGPDTDQSDLPVEGNLFSLLGFIRGDDPILKLKISVRDKIQFTGLERIVENGNNISYEFGTTSPDYEEIAAENPTEWASGRSWLDEIENGISGIAYYLYDEFPNPPSRSEHAIQTRKPLRSSASFKASYMKKILEDLHQRIG